MHHLRDCFHYKCKLTFTPSLILELGPSYTSSYQQSVAWPDDCFNYQYKCSLFQCWSRLLVLGCQILEGRFHTVWFHSVETLPAPLILFIFKGGALLSILEIIATYCASGECVDWQGNWLLSV